MNPACVPPSPIQNQISLIHVRIPTSCKKITYLLGHVVGDCHESDKFYSIFSCPVYFKNIRWPQKQFAVPLSESDEFCQNRLYPSAVPSISVPSACLQLVSKELYSFPFFRLRCCIHFLSSLSSYTSRLSRCPWYYDFRKQYVLNSIKWIFCCYD